MKKFRYLILALVISVITSCKQDQYYLYNDVNRLQFGPDPTLIYRASANLTDTLKLHTFYYDEPSVTEDTVFFDIYAIGGTKNTDRPFTLKQEQIANAANAISSTHYVPFTDPRVSKFYVIKAGTVHTRVPVILLRDPSLKTTTPKLKFVVVADGNFQTGEPSNLWRRIEFTDRLSQPSAWTASVSQVFFGKYSVVKHAFLIQHTGAKWDSTFLNEILANGSYGYYQTIAKTALINYNNANPGNPLTDESGELVVFP